MLPVKRLMLAALLAVPGPAAAHGGHSHDAPGWTHDPLVTVPLGVLLIVFLVGYQRLRRRSKIARPHSWLFVAGWLVLTLSLVSPLHEGGERSFALHMTEHELIMLLATLCLAAARAGGTLAWGLPASLRTQLAGGWKRPLANLWQRLTEPITATILQSLVMWAWHAPSLFNRALESRSWHVAQHLSFILASLLFWAAMLNVRRGSYLLSAACLFITSLVEGALGALMSFSTSPWYPAYAAMGLSGVGLDPVTDQRLAGLLMWIPGGLIHGAMAVALLYRWLRQSEPRAASLATRYR
jgi:cytochrome c oxidase assembly factor CtaG